MRIDLARCKVDYAGDVGGRNGHQLYPKPSITLAMFWRSRSI